MASRPLPGWVLVLTGVGLVALLGVFWVVGQARPLSRWDEDALHPPAAWPGAAALPRDTLTGTGLEVVRRPEARFRPRAGLDDADSGSAGVVPADPQAVLVE